jgi:peptidoglycan/LPS O-acetylase OafA/YrhL
MQAGYRADIDGLRALAIVPVVLFHAGVPGFDGGYIGVDIFFVISGFLITTVLVREIDQGDFSLLRFYERRARRILPALMAMIAVVLGISAWVFLPSDLEKMPASAMAATFFYSNHHLFATVGYFDAATDTKPLLHTWSLAVEEQFYIIFPLLLALIARAAAHRRRAILAGLLLISFMSAVVTQGGEDGYAFYLLAPRAWELLIGALVALSPMRQAGQRWRDGVASLGLGTICFAVASYSKATIFPGVTALAPVLGAAAILYSGPTTLVARVLSARPLVGIGLISYSLYLWHWPLIAFTEYLRDEKLSGWWSVAAVVASLCIAGLSWRWIEKPFRDPNRFSRKAIFGWSGAGMAAVGAASLALVMVGGWPSRFTAEQLRFVAAHGDISPQRAACHTAVAEQALPYCTLGNVSNPDSAMWSDSHGVEYAYAMAALPSRAGRGLLQMTHSGCPPVADYSIAVPRCDRENASAFQRITTDARIRTVYLAGYWLHVAETQPPAYWHAFERTIAKLVTSGRRVVIIGPAPAYPFDVPRALAHGNHRAGMKRSELVRRTAPLRAIARRWQARGVVFVDVSDSFCGPSDCALERHGAPLLFDAHHPSLTAAKSVAKQIGTVS